MGMFTPLNCQDAAVGYLVTLRGTGWLAATDGACEIRRDSDAGLGMGPSSQIVQPECARNYHNAQGMCYAVLWRAMGVGPNWVASGRVQFI
jgi:hypothetical protein